MIERKLTPDDTKFSDIPVKHERLDIIKSAVEEAFLKAKEIKEAEIKELGKLFSKLCPNYCKIKI